MPDSLKSQHSNRMSLRPITYGANQRTPPAPPNPAPPGRLGGTPRHPRGFSPGTKRSSLPLLFEAALTNNQKKKRKNAGAWHDVKHGLFSKLLTSNYILGGMCTSLYGTQMVTLYGRRITTHTAISVVTEPICPAKNISRLNSFFPSLCFFPRRGLGLDSSSGWRPRALSCHPPHFSATSAFALMRSVTFPPT